MERLPHDPKNFREVVEADLRRAARLVIKVQDEIDPQLRRHGRDVVVLDPKNPGGAAVRVHGGIVNLNLVALRRPAVCLIRGVNIDAGICLGKRHHLRAKFEVGEIMIEHRAFVVKMRARAVGDNAAILHAERAGKSLATQPSSDLPSNKSCQPAACSSGVNVFGSAMT